MEATLSVPNAIVFLFDTATKNVKVPEYINDAIVASNKSCVSVGTQPDVDGEVTIKLANKFTDLEKGPYELVFSGYIDTPGKKIAVVTSEFEKLLEMGVPNMKTEVHVWVDDQKYPSVVLIDAS